MPADEENLLEIVRELRTEGARLGAERLEAEMGGFGIEGYKIEWGKDAHAGCTGVRITGPDGQVSTGTVCFDRSRGPRRRCEFCRARWSVAECDYPVGGPCPKCKGRKTRGGGKCHACAGTGYRMCNSRVCASCRAHREPDEDYCPDHRGLAGFPPALRREKCFWTAEAGGVIRRDCLHQGCSEMIEYGDRVLFFPQRKRAMCRPCGERYLAISQL